MGQSARFITAAVAQVNPVVLDPAPAQAGQAVDADDEEAVVVFHSAGEDVVTFRVVGSGVLHILPDHVGAVGAREAEGVGQSSGIRQASRPGGNNGQSSCRQPSVTGLSLDRLSW